MKDKERLRTEEEKKRSDIAKPAVKDLPLPDLEEGVDKKTLKGGIDEAATSDMVKKADRKEAKDSDYEGPGFTGSGI